MTMTDTEAKALALVSIDPKALEHACLCAGRSVHHFDRMGDDLPLRSSIVAHARAIEQHEAFKREVSDELAKLGCWPDTVNLQRFIIPAPDPLVEALKEADAPSLGDDGYEAMANCGGEGFTYGCSWDWQCDTYDEGEGTCLCTRRCEWCQPLTADEKREREKLRDILATALAKDKVAEMRQHQPKEPT